MLRALFEKTDDAVYISHLDLMRLFQRAFKRAGLALTHTQGFNPRPSVSIALPLSLGVESHCELLDFDLEGEIPEPEELCRRLNEKLVAGVRVLQVYTPQRKIKHLALLECSLTLEYDGGVPQQAQERLQELFSRETLLVEKKSKNGNKQQDILTMIRRLTIEQESPQELTIRVLLHCQNPALNPMQLIAAIEQELPQLAPDFVRCCRMEVYDEEETVFR